MKLSNWKRWFSGGNAETAPASTSGPKRDDNAVLYAIGDVHGCDDLLGLLHERILDFHYNLYQDRPPRLIHIGDYVDRGADSVAVIDRLMAGLDGIESICLRGNHDDYLLQCSRKGDHRLWSTWLNYGGEETLQSLGVKLQGRFQPELVEEALGAERVAWLDNLPYYHLERGYLFVHAGIRPGVPLKKQTSRDMMLIRNSFLEHRGDFGFMVVHGHTPVDEPDLRSNRINIDTGAVYGGPLSAVVLDGSTPRFLSVG